MNVKTKGRKYLEQEHDRVQREGIIAKTYCDKICGDNALINCYGNYPQCLLHYMGDIKACW